MNDTIINLEEVYLTVWKRMLGDILDWPERKVIAWAARYGKYLADPGDIFYHEDPQYWAVSAFVPSAISEKLSPSQRSCLRNEILNMFGVKMCLYDYLDVDWKQYKSRIKTIIEKYAI